MNNIFRCFLITTCLLLVSMTLTGQVFTGFEQKLKPHPRLMFTAALEEELIEQMKKDELLQLMITELHQLAESSLNDPLINYQTLMDRPHRTTAEALAGKYVLDIASLTGSRLLLLSSSYRLSNDAGQKSKYLQRILAEIDAISSLPDWNPGQFLDVAELAFGLAVTYDWLFDDLSDQKKDEIEKTLIKNAIEPGIQAYEDSARWISRFNNWTQVCNGGLVLAALAIADNQPKVCQKMLDLAYEVMPSAMRAIYAPNGVYHEGPSYWQYGTTFNLLLIDALQTALNTNWNLLNVPGFEQTGDYQMHSISPTYRYFNYADAPEEARLAPALFKLSEFYDKPTYATFLNNWLRHIFSSESQSNSEPNFTLSGLLSQRKTARFYPLAIIWYQNEKVQNAKIPTCATFSGVATIRSNWFDKEAFYLGIKGGKNGVSHGHLDLGSFVLDALGIRWAVDLGREVYNLPGMFDYSEDGKRWTYYRLNTLSHNTLVINGNNQHIKASAHILHTDFSSNRSSVKVDLSQAYQGEAEFVVREFSLEDQSSIIIHDEIKGVKRDAEIRWGMLTRAEIQVDGNLARLDQEGRSLYASILQPADAHFQILSSNPQDKAEKQNEGTRMLGVVIHPNKPDLNIKIIFSTRKTF